MSKPIGIKYVNVNGALRGNDHQVAAGGVASKSGARAGQMGSLPQADGDAGAEVMALTA